MSLKIKYLQTKYKSASNIVLFSDEKFNINKLKIHFSNHEFSYVKDLLKSSDLKKKLLVFELSSKKKIVLVSIKKNFKTSEIESLGAEFYERINYGKNSEYFLISDSLENNNQNFLSHFLHGLKLKSYSFKKYKTKKEKREISINIIGKKKYSPYSDKIKIQSFRRGNFLCKRLSFGTWKCFTS